MHQIETLNAIVAYEHGAIGKKEKIPIRIGAARHRHIFKRKILNVKYSLNTQVKTIYT